MSICFPNICKRIFVNLDIDALNRWNRFACFIADLRSSSTIVQAHCTFLVAITPVKTLRLFHRWLAVVKCNCASTLHFPRRHNKKREHGDVLFCRLFYICIYYSSMTLSSVEIVPPSPSGTSPVFDWGTVFALAILRSAIPANSDSGNEPTRSLYNSLALSILPEAW